VNDRFFLTSLVFSSATGSHEINSIPINHTGNAQKERYIVNGNLGSNILGLVEPVNGAVCAAGNTDKEDGVAAARQQEVKNEGGESQTSGEAGKLHNGVGARQSTACDSSNRIKEESSS